MTGQRRDHDLHERFAAADPTYVAWMVEQGMVDEWPFEWTRRSAWMMRRGSAQNEIFKRRFNAAMQNMVQP